MRHKLSGLNPASTDSSRHNGKTHRGGEDTVGNSDLYRYADAIDKNLVAISKGAARLIAV